MSAWLQEARGGKGDELESIHGFGVEREVIATGGDYNLSGERYKSEAAEEHDVRRARIGDICTVNPAKRLLQDLPPETEVSFVPMADLNEWRTGFEAKETKQFGEVGASYTYFADGDVLLAKVTPCFENGKAGIARNLRNGIGFGSSEFYVLRPGESVLAEWVYRCITHEDFRSKAIAQMTGTGGLQRVPRAFVEGFEIPLPSLEVQREIVAEIEGYQRVIEGARAVIDNYRPHIPVDPDWPMVELSEIFDALEAGVSVNSENRTKMPGELGVLKTSAVTSGTFDPEEHKAVLLEEDTLASRKMARIAHNRPTTKCCRVNKILAVGLCLMN
ncbi:restriction endonuclease subunit S [Rhizobium sp. IY2]|uniref:restriction endonuclease subunit S n=1 Tax=Rhizobium sp. IY2 TaxID=3397853 RepID=UPI0039E19919